MSLRLIRYLCIPPSTSQSSSTSTVPLHHFQKIAPQYRRNASAVEFKIERKNATKEEASGNAAPIDANELRPSEAFIKSLSKEQLRHFHKMFAELELYVLIGRYVPRALSDEDWNNAFKKSTVAERMVQWEYYALRNARLNRITEIQNEKAAKMAEYCAQQKAIHDAGAMGYSSECYSLLLDPSHHFERQTLVTSSRYWASIRSDKPRIVFDLQFLANDTANNKKNLYLQLLHLIKDNYQTASPLPIVLANLEDKQEMMNLESRLASFFPASSSALLPEISSHPVTHFCPNKEETVYISSNAAELLDGPINHLSSIVVCLSMDKNKESLGAARRTGIRYVRLPIQKYVKWKYGGLYLPFANVMNTLREVYLNQGDWQTALLNNISRRHLEDKTEKDKEKLRELKARKKELTSIIEAAKRLSEEWERQQGKGHL